jgi:hypothetical protein
MGGSLEIVRAYVIRSLFADGLGQRFWSRSYCLVSAGEAPLEIIKRYIQDKQRLTRHPITLVGECAPSVFKKFSLQVDSKSAGNRVR